MNKISSSHTIRLWALLGIACAGPAIADMVQIGASRDNTLYESAQGALSNGSGEYLFVGRTSSNGVRRAVIAFDDLSSIPAGSTIDSVRLHLELSRESSSATTLSLWRLVSDWGEGASNATGQEGGGAASMLGDATWIHTFYDSQTWLVPGGDFMETASAELQIDAIGSFTVESTEALVNNVQGWLDSPDTNYGWILTAVETGTTAKRFNSRENQASNGPMLEVSFTPPPDDAPNNNWSGLWYDPTLDGEGFQVLDTPAGWAVYFYGYTADEERLWLLSELNDIGDPDLGKSYSFNMLIGTPGTFNNPTPPGELEQWGTLQVNFESCSAGFMVLESTDMLKISNVIKIIGIDGVECVDE